MTSAKMAALATAGLLALTGCATGNPQVAAYVDGARIAQSEVDAISQVLAEVSADPADTAGDFGTTVVTIMVQAKLAKKAADAASITVTDAERQQVFASNELYAALISNPVTADFMNGFADTAILVNNEAGSAAIKNALASTEVRVNPRFGTWDPAAASLVQGSSGSLSVPAPLADS